MHLGHSESLPDDLLAVRVKLTDAAAHWADKAIQTQHCDDARRYAVVAQRIADLAGDVEKLRYEWQPSFFSRALTQQAGVER